MINPKIENQLDNCLRKISENADVCGQLFNGLNKSIDIANEEYRQYSLASPYVGFSVFNNDVDVRNKEIKLMRAQNQFVSLMSQCLGYIDIIIFNQIENSEPIDGFILKSLDRLINMVKPATIMYTNISTISYIVTRLECKVLQENSYKYIGLRNKLSNFRINLQ